MPTLTFIADNKSAQAEDNTLLREVCQANDFTLPFGCENGVCGTCLVSIKQGAEYLTEKTSQEKETLDTIMAYEDQRLACQCRVQGGDVTFDLE